jgi:uncharacterized protein (DUF433 family)
MADELPNEDEALEDVRADEYEARLDELEEELPAFERRMRTIERTTAVRDEPHNGNMADMRGAYSADRAAALSGVPLSTVHWWARNDILVPSVSPVRVKLWSYADLMSLRVIHWLRREKKTDEGTTIPRTAMPAVRRALRELAALDMALWTEDGGPGISVNRAGEVFLMTGPSPERAADRQRALGSTDALDVLAPFPTESARGPNLVEPRPLLRIVPGKLGGSPHVQHTRLESRAIGALAGRGFDRSKIHRLYPEIEPAAIGEAVDLERQLARNLGRELVAA